MQFHIVGLDLSLSGTGIARIRPGDAVPIRTDVVGSAPTRLKLGVGAYYPATLTRLRALAGRIVRTALEGADPEDVILFVMEGPSYGSHNGQEHARAGLWWLVFHLLEKRGLFAIVPPTTLKRYLTGKGGGRTADKNAVIAAINRNFPHLGIIDNNEADALGLGLMGARELGSPMEPSVQRVTPNALDAVVWPDIITQRRIANG